MTCYRAPGTSVVLVFVRGTYWADDPSKHYRFGPMLQANFLMDGSSRRTDEIFTHNELIGEDGVPGTVVARDVAASLAAQLILTPRAACAKLFARASEFQESGREENAPDNSWSPMETQLAVSPASIMPPRGFVVQLPAVGVDDMVCVMCPCMNQDPSVDPGAPGAPINVQVSQIVVKMY